MTWISSMRINLVHIVAIAIVLSMVSCSEDSPTSAGGSGQSGDCIFDPQDFSWVIEVSDPDGRDMRDIMIVDNGAFDPQNPPTVSLRVNGASVPITFSGYGNWWFGEVSLEAGQAYSFELTVDGQKMSATLTIAYTPDVVFPDDIVAGQPATVTWTMNGEAGCQVAAAGSGDMQDDEDNYTRWLDKTAREFTFPAGCVPGWGDGETYLSLAIFNRNVTAVGKSLILISNGLATRDYQDQ